MNNASNATNLNLKRFLNEFPPQELWRFFVERSKYRYESTLLHYLYYYATDLSSSDIQQTSAEQIKTYFSSMSLQEIVSKPKTEFKQMHLNHFITTYRLHKRDFIHSLERHQAWRGFEENEPGYLVKMTEGFCFILEHLVNHKPFNLQFIKDLHKQCTRDVVNMLSTNRPGQFRKVSIFWEMRENMDSLLGLRQNFNYLKSIELQYGDPKLFIKNANGSIHLKNFTEIDIDKTADVLQERLLVDKGIMYITKGGSEKFLNKVGKNLIFELEASSRVAQTRIQKLTAIFTYLKKTVLHHPFADGVGRTYSMLLLQYLLMRDGFMPFIITNSNMIPGMSVEEMVNEYFRGEEEMECILNDVDYINTQAFVSPNINTNELLLQVTDKERTLFEQSQKIYKNTQQQCLEALEHSMNPNKILANQMDPEGYAPLHQAARDGHAATARYWLKEGANIDMLTDVTAAEPNMTAIELACIRGHDSVALLLFNAGAQIPPAVNGRNHLIHIAVKNGLLDCVNTLVSRDPALVNLSNHHDLAPLDIATNFGDLAQVLINTKALIAPGVADKPHTENVEEEVTHSMVMPRVSSTGLSFFSIAIENLRLSGCFFNEGTAPNMVL